MSGMQRRLVVLALASAALLATPASAFAGYAYSVSLRFSGSYTYRSLSAGKVVEQTISTAHWRLSSTIVMGHRGGNFQPWPARAYPHIQLVQSGFTDPGCDPWVPEHFADRMSAAPTLAGLTLTPHVRRSVVTFFWAGESVDRTFSTLGETPPDCLFDVTGTQPALGNADIAGSAPMLARFGVKLHVPTARIAAGGSFHKRYRIRRGLRDVFDGDGTTFTLIGIYRLSILRIG